VRFLAPDGDVAFATMKEPSAYFNKGEPLRIGEGMPLEQHRGYSTPLFVVRSVKDKGVPYVRAKRARRRYHSATEAGSLSERNKGCPSAAEAGCAKRARRSYHSAAEAGSLSERDEGIPFLRRKQTRSAGATKECPSAAEAGCFARGLSGGDPPNPPRCRRGRACARPHMCPCARPHMCTCARPHMLHMPPPPLLHMPSPPLTVPRRRYTFEVPAMAKFRDGAAGVSGGGRTQ
jgi:hypothetical protein